MIVETTYLKQPTNTEHAVICCILTFCVRFNFQNYENIYVVLLTVIGIINTFSNLTLFPTDAPVFKMVNETKKVNPGENVTFECCAEGNPPPEISWHYTSAVNVMETTGGRQKNISITGAMSTNAGVYVCVATNKVGRLTRSETLMMKGIIIESVQSTYENLTDFSVAAQRLHKRETLD